jgi:hypothetical protein
MLVHIGLSAFDPIPIPIPILIEILIDACDCKIPRRRPAFPFQGSAFPRVVLLSPHSPDFPARSCCAPLLELTFGFFLLSFFLFIVCFP